MFKQMMILILVNIILSSCWANGKNITITSHNLPQSNVSTDEFACMGGLLWTGTLDRQIIGTDGRPVTCNDGD